MKEKDGESKEEDRETRAEGPYVQLPTGRDHRSSSTKYIHLSFFESRPYLVTKCTGPSVDARVILSEEVHSPALSWASFVLS